MKLLITLLSIIIYSNILFSQNYQIEWQSCFGGTIADEARDIIGLESGYFIAGYTGSNDGDITFTHGSSDYWVVKIDFFGNIVWEKTYGGTQSEGISTILPDINGNNYLLGGSNSSDCDITTDPYIDSWDFWIIKVDSSGNKLWNKIVGGNGDEILWTGTPTSDGGVVALGWSGSENGDVSINYGAYDAWMVKLSSEGEVEWDFTLGTNQQDYGQAIIQTTDGGFLVGCSSEIYGPGNLNCETNGNADGILVKLDSLRNIEWQQCYGGSWHDGIIGLLEIEDGYMFLAYASTNDGDLVGSGWHEGYNHLGNPTSDTWAVKVDFLGNIIWKKCYGGSKYDDSQTIYQLEDGSFMIFGNTDSHDGDVIGNHSGNDLANDIWAIKISSEGELLSQQCFGGWGDDRIDFGVVKKSDNDFVIAGQTDRIGDVNTCDVHTLNIPDYWVFEIKDTTVSLPENRQIAQLKVYPNPAKDYVVFENTAWLTSFQHPDYIRITDILSQTIEIIEIKGEKTIWDINQIKPGIYFYKTEDGNFMGKLVISR